MSLSPIAPAVQATPSVADLQADAQWQRNSFEIHWAICRTRMADRPCRRCDDLDSDAFAAERVYLEANARVMSAAPDLLAALTGQRCFDCAQWLELGNPNRRPCDVCEPAMAAIRKALGETAHV